MYGVKRLAAAAATIAAIASIGAMSASAATAGKSCQTRQWCEHHGTTYLVSGIKFSKTIGTGFMKTRTSGVYVLVTVTMKNLKSESSTILAANLTLRSRSGDSYDVTTDAMAIDNALVLTQELQPKLPEKVVLVYQLPKSAARGATLVVNDMWSGDKATIGLGI